MQLITSKDNDKIKEIKKIRDSKKVRDEKNVYIIEGLKMLKEAMSEGVKINTIIICEECLEKTAITSKLLYEIAKFNCIYVTKNIFNTLTEVVNPQGVLAIVEKPDTSNIKYDEDIIMLLDNIQDPGNLGTVLRTADAIGLTQVLVTKNTVNPYNPKVIRATMGAIFRVNVVVIEDFEILKRNGYTVIATSLKGSNNIYDVKFNKHVIIIGNESNGISEELLDFADIKAKLPMNGKAESLNASVAASIIMYEYMRQKLY